MYVSVNYLVGIKIPQWDHSVNSNGYKAEVEVSFLDENTVIKCNS